jgi:diguanylate cyclase (GGDEF)-like protein
MSQTHVTPPFSWPPPRASLRWLYPLVGVVLSLALLVGLVAFRNFYCGDALSMSWICAELGSQSVTYGYLAVSTTVVFVVVGGVLGFREERLWASSTTDPATCLSNRRHFEDNVSRELACAAHSGTPLALLIIDVDGLKPINDERGHDAGDAALQLVAESLRRTCRSRDLAARWGGDEFVVLAPRTNGEQALILAHRIRATLTGLALAHAGELPAVSVSIGISDLERAGSMREDVLFVSADRALYQAKQSGRDRVLLARRRPARNTRPETLVEASNCNENSKEDAHANA